MDKRRRQWITWDVFFNDGDLGSAIRTRFGVVGWVVFNGFICACKKNSVQGRMSYITTTDALAAMGIPGLRLADEDGAEWTLEDFWTFLGRKKQVRRQRRGRVTDIISTRWNNWQTPPGRARETATTPQEHLNNGSGTHDQQKETSTSGATNTTGLETIVTPEIDPDVDLDPDPDPDLDGDIDPDSAREPAGTSTVGGGFQPEDGEGKIGGLAKMLAAACTGKNRERVTFEAQLVVAACKPHAPFAILERAVMGSIRAKESPVLPRAMVETFKRECRLAGLPAPLIPEIWKKAS